MTTQLEFRLLDLRTTDGEIDADRLVELVPSLKDIALEISRVETGAGSLGGGHRSRWNAWPG